MKEILITREVVKELKKENLKVDKRVFDIKDRIVIKIFKKTFIKFYNYIRICTINTFLE